jgi:transposase
MKNTSTPSVFGKQSRELSKLYQDAPSPRQILCVALDYAKSKHLALCCDGHGDVLKAAFPVRNDADGLAFLIEQIQASARRRNIEKKHIFIGGEDEPAYVSNFLAALREKGYLVVRVNAFEAKHNRKGQLASTDTIDLLGIASTMISRRARSTTPPAETVYL